MSILFTEWRIPWTFLFFCSSNSVILEVIWFWKNVSSNVCSLSDRFFGNLFSVCVLTFSHRLGQNICILRKTCFKEKKIDFYVHDPYSNTQTYISPNTHTCAHTCSHTYSLTNECLTFSKLDLYGHSLFFFFISNPFISVWVWTFLAVFHGCEGKQS